MKKGQFSSCFTAKREPEENNDIYSVGAAADVDGRGRLRHPSLPPTRFVGVGDDGRRKRPHPYGCISETNLRPPYRATLYRTELRL